MVSFFTLNPSSQLIHIHPCVRKDPTTCRANEEIHPSLHNCRMMASTNGNPVWPWRMTTMNICKKKYAERACFNQFQIHIYHRYCYIMITCFPLMMIMTRSIKYSLDKITSHSRQLWNNWYEYSIMDLMAKEVSSGW